MGGLQEKGVPAKEMTEAKARSQICAGRCLKSREKGSVSEGDWDEGAGAARGQRNGRG